VRQPLKPSPSHTAHEGFSWPLCPPLKAASKPAAPYQQPVVTASVSIQQRTCAAPSARQSLDVLAWAHLPMARRTYVWRVPTRSVKTCACVTWAVGRRSMSADLSTVLRGSICVGCWSWCWVLSCGGLCELEAVDRGAHGWTGLPMHLPYLRSQDCKGVVQMIMLGFVCV